MEEMEYAIGISAKSNSITEQIMSLAIVLAINNDVYIAADSRSTKKIVHEHSDDYRKIAYLKNENKIVVSTGDNDFDGKTLTELVKSCKTQRELEEKVLRYNANFRFISQGDPLYMETVSFAGGVLRSERIPLDENVIYYSGPTAITEFLSYIPSPQYNEETNIIKFLNTVYDMCCCLPELSDNTIGGPVHILKLSPGEPYKWLQNDYEL